MRSRYKVVFTILIMITLIILSQNVRLSIQNSLSLCVSLLIPALFPFFIISGMLFDFGIDLLIPPSLCSFFIGLICGYPLGTRTVCQCYQQQRLSRQQAQALLMCTANASPAFVVIVLGETILKSKSLGFLLLLFQSINALILFLLLVPKGKYQIKSTAGEHILTSLIHNTKAAIEQILFVCSITMVFGIISDLISPILSKRLKRLIGLIEILHGITLLDHKDLWAAAMLLGFSGLCVWAQCIFYIQKTDLNISYLILGKIQAALTLPQYINLFIAPAIGYKILSIIIIILTNIFLMCIIKTKGCDKKHDFFKKHRKMLRLLRASNENSI